MGIAVYLALKGRGKTYPNPAVGAVVVKNGRIVGRGFHRRSGLPHAEVEAIRDAGRRAKGADLYVTLEPCCHQGQTPPCTRAIIDAGIRRVFASTIDPNPLVRGKGVKELEKAGIPVQMGLGADRSTRINEAYLSFMKTGRPFVTIKVAQTLDGKIATRTRDARWITSRRARDWARAMRGEAQAIVVGAGTVAADDPLLLSSPPRKKDYLRCILDAHLSIPATSRLARTARAHPVIVYCAAPRPGQRGGYERRKALLERQGLEVVAVRAARGPGVRSGGVGGRPRAQGAVFVDPREVLRDLARRRVMHVWVEGGSAVFTSFLRARLVDKVLAFVAPRIMGSGGSIDAFGDLKTKLVRECAGFRVDSLECVGPDVLLTLYPNRRSASLRGLVAGALRSGSGAGAASGASSRVPCAQTPALAEPRSPCASRIRYGHRTTAAWRQREGGLAEPTRRVRRGGEVV